MHTKKTLPSSAALISGIIICLAAPFAHARPSVPLTGAFTYTSTLDMTRDSGCPLAGMLVGTGTLSHLGKSAVVATDCVTQVNGMFVILRGAITVTAANGDKLTAAYSGTFVPAEGPVYEMKDVTYTIEGGTGRFAGAKGSGRLEGSENLATHQGSLTVNGNISY